MVYPLSIEPGQNVRTTFFPRNNVDSIRCNDGSTVLTDIAFLIARASVLLRLIHEKKSWFGKKSKSAI
jgi:hypothetical protein